jgi:signal-transduction protein with cAMP-binding, CBS, and nucleotidyltransferase domain
MLAHDIVMLPVVERGKVLGVARLVDIFDRVAGLIPNQG